MATPVTLLRHASLALLLLSPVAVGLGSGCGTAYDVCEVVCDCTKCNDRTRDECEIEVGRMLEVADAYECTDEMDVYVECVTNDFECDDTTFSSNDCAEDFADLFECIDDNSDIIDLGSAGAGEGEGEGPAGG